VAFDSDKIVDFVSTYKVLRTSDNMLLSYDQRPEIRITNMASICCLQLTVLSFGHRISVTVLIYFDVQNFIKKTNDISLQYGDITRYK